MVKKILIEIRLRNLITYVFKGYVKIIKIDMVNVFFSYLNHASYLNKFLYWIMCFLESVVKTLTIFAKRFHARCSTGL